MTKLVLAVTFNCVKPVTEFQKIDQLSSTMKWHTARQSGHHMSILLLPEKPAQSKCLQLTGKRDVDWS